MKFDRVLAVGDIHGYYDKLVSLMRKVRFVPNKDLLVFLGDYIDRGPDSVKCLDYVMRLQQRFSDCVIALKGNHEALAIDSLLNGIYGYTWIRNGGFNTSKRFMAMSDRELKTRLDWMRKLPACYRYGDFFFCHAGIQPYIPLGKQREKDLLWIRHSFFELYDGGMGTIVVGHTPVQKLFCEYGEEVVEPQFLENNIIMCDTGSFLDNGKISCVDVLSRKFWQA